jgi:hypothetical protein
MYVALLKQNKTALEVKQTQCTRVFLHFQQYLRIISYVLLKVMFDMVTVRYIHLVNGCMLVFSKKWLVKIHAGNFRLVLHTQLCSRLFSAHKLHKLFLFSGFVSNERFVSRASKQTTNEF